MEDLLTNVLDFVGKACWVKITTEKPRCIYYFGPFASKKEAASAEAGYIEDLRGEGAEIVEVKIERCKPKELTIYDDSEEELPAIALAPVSTSRS